jgi:antirestriction protein ArdC
VFWKPVDPSASAEASDSSEARQRRFIARGYGVFNADQVEGFELPSFTPLSDMKRCATAEQSLDALDINIQIGSQEAYYRPSTDCVSLPDFERVRDAASFYAVAIHECGHATDARHRLDRDLTGRFGTAAYAAEGICVEFAAGFVLADLGFAHHPRPDHATYIQSWLELLQDDPRAIFTATSKAQDIADWMWTKQAAPPG